MYDRCGRLTYFIEGAQSLLSHHHHIASAIFNTFYHQPCGYCQHDSRHELRKHGHNVSEDYDEFSCKESSLQVPEPDSSEALDFWSRFIRAQHHSSAFRRPLPDLPPNPLPTAATIIRQLSGCTPGSNSTRRAFLQSFNAINRQYAPMRPINQCRRRLTNKCTSIIVTLSTYAILKSCAKLKQRCDLAFFHHEVTLLSGAELH